MPRVVDNLYTILLAFLVTAACRILSKFIRKNCSLFRARCTHTHIPCHTHHGTTHA